MSQVLVAALLAAAVTAAPPPQGPAKPAADPRLRWIDYAPGAVVTVTGAARTATQILFGEDETIRHVALGDPAAWEVAAEGGVLFLKPLAAGPPTNLIVMTQTRQGKARHYHFDLLAQRQDPRRPADVAIGFRHPADDAERLAQALSAQTEALSRKVLQLQLERGAIEGPRNLDYELAGDPSLAPSEVSDNGAFTVLRFPAGRPLPALYLVGPDGTETLARFDVRGEFVVVHQTAAILRLRSGRRALCLINRAYAAQAPASGSLTASPAVARSLTDTP